MVAEASKHIRAGEEVTNNQKLSKTNISQFSLFWESKMDDFLGNSQRSLETQSPGGCVPRLHCERAKEYKFHALFVIFYSFALLAPLMAHFHSA